MDLVERYLAAVAPLLPRTQRRDILAELRDSLLSQLEEHRAQLGREPDSEEVEALLKAYGHPMAVALPYRRPWQFIGPEIGFWYRYALVAWLGCGLVVSLVTGGMSLARGSDVLGALGTTAAMLWQAVIWGIGTLTLLAMVLERLGAGRWLAGSFRRIGADWRPRELPELVVPARGGMTASAVAWDLVGIGLLALWMSGVAGPLFQRLPDIVHWRPNDFVFALRLPFLLVATVQTAADLLALRWPGGIRPALALGVVVKLGALGMLLALLPHRPWAQAVNLPPEIASLLVPTLNIVLGACWVMVAAMTAVLLVWNVAMLRTPPKDLKAS